MKGFREYNLNLKIIIILAGIMLVNTICIGTLYFMREGEINLNGISFLLLLVVSFGFCYVAIKKYIVLPVKNILIGANDLAIGSIPSLIIYKDGDELGQLADCINSITKNKIELSDFVKKIGDGDIAANYELLSNKDIMGYSLISMRDKIKRYQKKMLKGVGQMKE